MRFAYFIRFRIFLFWLAVSIKHTDTHTDERQNYCCSTKPEKAARQGYIEEIDPGAGVIVSWRQRNQLTYCKGWLSKVSWAPC